MYRHLKQIWKLVHPWRFRLAWGVACGLVSALANPLLVVLLKLIADSVQPQSGPLTTHATASPPPLPSLGNWPQQGLEILGLQSKPSLAFLICLIPLLIFARGLFGYLNQYLMNAVSITIVTRLQTRLFKHVTGLSLQSLNRFPTGDLVKRLHDAHAIQQTISLLLSVLAREPFVVLSLLTVLLCHQPRLTFVTVGLLVVCLLPTLRLRERARRQAKAFHRSTSAMNNLMEESFAGRRIVKAFNLEDKVSAQFDSLAAKVRNGYLAMLRAVNLPGPLMEAVGAVGVAAFLLYSLEVAHETPGDLIQFVGAVFLLYAPLKALARLPIQIEHSRAAAESVFALLEIQSTVLEPGQPKPLVAAGATIQFDAVSFHYEQTEVLHHVNLTIPAGCRTALVGPSGAGKSTLLNLLLRFYDPQEGAIRIGPTDLREVSTRDLHDQIGVVTQETFLFNDTIANNIAVGRPNATREEVVNAARMANALEFIQGKPQGFDTIVGENGVLLSGGERQRLSIARVILKNAPLAVLDEGFTALDSRNECEVQEAFEALMRGRTTLCIAHRLATVQHADLIVVMDKGRIVQQGKHPDLLAQDGLYQTLFQNQFRR